MLYLEGKIRGCPTSPGSLFPDTIAQIELIKAVNRAGFLTIMSQDGLKDEEVWQRSAVDGFMFVGDYERLKNAFDSTEFICYGVSILTNNKEEGLRYPITLTLPEKKPMTFMPLTCPMAADMWNEVTRFCPRLKKPKGLYYVYAIDPIWERSNYLVEEILKVLVKK